MICPRCGSEKIRVVDTMPDEKQRVYRRRKCTECGFIIHTVETVCVKKRKNDNTEIGLIPIKELPPKEYRCREDRSYLCNEFMRMNIKYAKVDLGDNVERPVNYTYSSLRQLISQNEYPFYIIIRNGDLYLVRTDM